MNGSKGGLMRRNIAGLRIVFATLVALVASALVNRTRRPWQREPQATVPAMLPHGRRGTSWLSAPPRTRLARSGSRWPMGSQARSSIRASTSPTCRTCSTSSLMAPPSWILERDATNHEISMPDEKALEYTITNTDKRATPKYRITNTYITDPSRNTLLIRTRFQSLDGNSYRLYLLENPSMAGGGANDNAWWDGTNSALMSSGTETLFGSSTTVVSALKVASPNGFVAHENGYAGAASDCYVELRAGKGAQQPVRQHCQQRQRRPVRRSRQRWRRHDVHRRARLWERRGIGRRRGQRIACGRLHRSRGRLPRNFSIQRGLERLCQRPSRSTCQRVKRHAASPRLLRRRDGLTRR